MDEDLKGKTALVTGAGRPAVSDTPSRSGWPPWAVMWSSPISAAGCRDPRPDGDARRDGGHRRRPRREVRCPGLGRGGGCDRSVSVTRMAETLRERCGHVHILVNNAGASFGISAAHLSYDEEAWIRTVDVCLFSVFRVSRAVLPLMLGEPGAIVNTASRAGKVPPCSTAPMRRRRPGIMLTKTMARELAPAASGSTRSARADPDRSGEVAVSAWRPPSSEVRSRSGKRRCARRSPSADRRSGGCGKARRLSRLGCLAVHHRAGVHLDGGQCMECEVAVTHF